MNDHIQAIVQLTNRRAQPIETVMLKAKLTHKQFQDAIEAAGQRGYCIKLNGGYVSSQIAVAAEKKLVVGEKKAGRYTVGVWTDQHFGCRHCDEDAALAFLHEAHDAGAKVIVSTGDTLDGNRPALLADQKYVGFDDQFDRLRRVLRKAPPAIYVCIDGNHDGYYSSAIGTPSGRLVSARLKEAGIRWHFLGMCEGWAEIHAADWFLWHPSGGAASQAGVRTVIENKAKELQEHVDIIALGHLHKWASFDVMPEGIHGICAGTFQRKRSEFANRISPAWNVGGMLVSYDVDSRGRVSAIASTLKPARP